MVKYPPPSSYKYVDGIKNHSIIYVGKITSCNRMRELYSLADVFILCSRKETYSMTCAEALCCGTPVVGFYAGAPETVFKEPLAKFVEYGNLDELYNAVVISVIK